MSIWWHTFVVVVVLKTMHVHNPWTWRVWYNFQSWGPFLCTLMQLSYKLLTYHLQKMKTSTTRRKKRLINQSPYCESPLVTPASQRRKSHLPTHLQVIIEPWFVVPVTVTMRLSGPFSYCLKIFRDGKSGGGGLKKIDQPVSVLWVTPHYTGESTQKISPPYPLTGNYCHDI